LRFCLVSADQSANREIEGIKTRAQKLVEQGHDVTLLIAVSNDQKEKFATKLVSEKTGAPPYSVRLVVPDTDVANLSRFEAASSETKKLSSVGVAIWKEVLELHNVEPFNLIEGESCCGALALTAFANIAPVIVRLDSSAVIFKRPKSIFESLSFDEQVSAMFERMAIGWCSAVVIADAQLQNLIVEETGCLAPPILIDRGNDPNLLSTFYKDVISKKKAVKRTAYLRPVQSLCPDALMMFQAFDQMLYNYLYQNSWRFRLYHWRQMYKSKPAQFKTKLTIAALRPIAAATKSAKLSSKLSELERLQWDAI